MHARMEYNLCSTVSWGTARVEELKTDRSGQAEETGREDHHVIKKKLIQSPASEIESPQQRRLGSAWEKSQLCRRCPEFPAFSKSSTNQQFKFATTKVN